MTRPRVILNVAITADGKLATANRAVSSFGSPRDQTHLYELRATVDAIMSGARTLNLNPVTLDAGAARYRRQRLRNGLSEHPLRIVVTGSGSIDPKAEIFKHRFSPILLLTTRRAGPRRLQALKDLADQVKICGSESINFRLTLRWLRSKWNVRRLLCEGGGELNDALFRADLVDELHLTICPFIFGGRTAPTLADGLGAPGLPQASRLILKSSRRTGDELFLVYVRNNKTR
jgi:riboflavin-specific deaminase-like protein